MDPELQPDLGEIEQAIEHGEALGAAHGPEAATGMPQLDPSNYPNLIFWLLVSLVALYFILTKLALPRLTSVLTERHDAIANDIEQAQVLKRRAEEAEAAYNRALAEARKEAERISAENKAEIQSELKGLMAKADAEIAARAAESEGRIRDIRDSAARSVEEVARDTALAIVEAFTPGAADRAAVDAAVSSRLKG